MIQDDKNKDGQLFDMIKYYNKVIMYQQNYSIFSVTCIF